MTLPRYLTSPDVDVDLALRAEEIVEKRIGYALAPTEYHEIVRYSDKTAATLQHTPVARIISVRGRIHTWPAGLKDFAHSIGKTSWTTIDVSHTILHQKDDRAALVVPMSLFGATYDELAVTYVAGVSPVPDEVVEAVATVYELLRSGEIDEWNCTLPTSVHDVIERFRRKEAFN